jgi:hypothetical protein
MKKTIATIILGLGIIISNLFGQMPGSISPPDFNAEKAAGIFQYDIKKVIKKLKITDDSVKVKVSGIINKYNSKMYELSMIHATSFQELEAEFDRNIQIAMRNQDRSKMYGVRAKIQRIIPPIRIQVLDEEKLLNHAMAGLITEKQNKKWLRYQNNKKAN